MSVEERLAALEAKVREHEDMEAIRQAVYTYARGTDRCHRDLVAHAYHDDAYDDHGTFGGDKQTTVDTIVSNPSGSPVSMHHVGNVLIELQGDAANVESYFFACQVRETDGRRYGRVRAGRYLDRFERREGVWRIARRFVVDDWSRIDELTTPDPIVDDRCRHGSRDTADPSYQLSDFTALVSGQ